MRLLDLRRIARIAVSSRGALHATEKQSLMKYNATISKYVQLIFCYVTQNLSPFNMCKDQG